MLPFALRALPRRLLALLFAACTASFAGAVTLVDYDLASAPGNQAFSTGTAGAVGVTASPLQRGAGLGTPTGAGSLSSNGWHNSEATDFIEFGFTVNAGLEVDLEQILIGTQSSNTGPGSVGVYYSATNSPSETLVATLTQPAGATRLNSSLDLTSLPPVSGTVTFRLRALGTTSANGGTTGSTGSFRVTNFTDASTNVIPLRVSGVIQDLGGVDTTPPTTTLFSPVDGATGVSILATPSLTFGEPVQLGTGTLLIKRSADGSVFESITLPSAQVVVSSNTTVVITPSAPFLNNTGYYLEIPSGAITDLAGNAYAGLAGATAWNFTTIAAAVLPSVTQDVAATAQIKLTSATTSADFYAEGSGQGNFAVYSLASFVINKLDFGLPGSSSLTGIDSIRLSLTQNTRTFTTNAAGTEFEVFFTTDPLIGNIGSKRFNPTFANGIDNAQYTFTPVSLGRFSYHPVPADGSRQTYTLNLGGTASALLSRLNTGAEFSLILAAVLPADAITFSGKGNTFDPGDPALSITVTETTGVDTTPPTVAFFIPASGSGSLPTGANLIVSFDEIVQKGAGSVSIRRVSDGALFESLAISDSRVTVNLGTVTIDPAGILASATAYYVEIDAGAITDAAGNAFAGLSGPSAWTFTTAQPPIAQTGPFPISQNAPAGTVIGALNPAVTGREGIRYALLGGSGGTSPMRGENGQNVLVTPIFTIGDTLPASTGALNPTSAGAFSPPGTPDGIGAYALNADTIRVFINHEISLPASGTAAYPYTLANGTVMTKGGARISFLDLDRATRRVIDGGLAIARIYDRAGVVVTNPATQLDLGGLDRFCSSSLYEPDLFGTGRGLVDRIYFTGEETSTGFGHPHGGTMWALDTATGDFWAVPDMGRGSWENVALLDTGTTTHVAFVLGDDAQGTPLWLYVGEKSTAPGATFLERNGLSGGQLYAWKATNGDTNPQQFNGTGAFRAGSWVAVAARVPASAGTSGHDALGYRNDTTLQAVADAAGAFSFSRPEDLSTSPTDGTRFAFASTGRGSLYPADNWGDTYIVDVDFVNAVPTAASIVLLYSGDDAGGDQFGTPEEGLRCPDNLDWADDGFIYVQEDQANQIGNFGAAGHESSIWRLDPANGDARRLAEIDRSVIVPLGSADTAPTDVGNWESSGILDVSSLFGEDPGTLFLFNIQTHSITNGLISAKNLSEGGQVCFFEIGRDTGAFRLNPNTGVITLANPAALDASARPAHYLRVQAFDGTTHTLNEVAINVTTTPVTAPSTFKAATFNTSHYRATGGALVNDLSTLASSDTQSIARIVQRVNPDVLILNEFDYDEAGVSSRLIRENYLEVSQNGEAPVYYPYVYHAPANTGVPSGKDLDNNGVVVTNPTTAGYGEDALGFGVHPGQYAFLILSKFPIDRPGIRTFQQFLWKDMPGALLPDDPDLAGPADWYSPDELAIYRLSSKNHVDVPVLINGTPVHLLVSHPTPPVFDTPAESSRWKAGVDHNGRRNSDEIRFWSDYVDPAVSAYIYDDAELAANDNVPPALGARTGGLPANTRFILFGDQNADKDEGDSTDPAIKQIIGGVAAVGGATIPANPLYDTSFVPAGGNGPSADDTAAFSGGVRIDYVLPSAYGLDHVSSSVFWPPTNDPLYPATTVTDHHLVQVTLSLTDLPTGIETAPLSTYYAPAFGLTGPALQAALHDIIDGHTVVSYNDVDDVMKALDETTPGSGQLRLVYSLATLPAASFVGASGTTNATSWNREHVWPRNDGVGDDGPDFSDLHHLFPAQVDVNSLRSSRRFEVVTGTRVTDAFAPESAANSLDYFQNAAAFEPLDRDKGLVARALLYMATRYDGAEPLTSDLVLSNNPVFGALDQGVLDTLLAWNRAYPPDTYERSRNAAIQAGVSVGSRSLGQGNRNPYIDFPQFADVIFVPAGTATFAKWQYQRFTSGELQNPAVSASAADPDGDSRNNYAEFLLNGDPLAANDTPLTLTQAGNQITLVFHRPKGGLVPAAKVQTATDLVTGFTDVPDWTASATFTDLGDHEQVTYTATLNPTEPRRFWRVVFE